MNREEALQILRTAGYGDEWVDRYATAVEAHPPGWGAFSDEEALLRDMDLFVRAYDITL